MSNLPPKIPKSLQALISGAKKISATAKATANEKRKKEIERERKIEQNRMARIQNIKNSNNNNNNTLFSKRSTKPTLNRVSSYKKQQNRLLPSAFGVRPNISNNVLGYSHNNGNNNSNPNNTLFANQSTKPTLNRVSSYNQSQRRLLPNVFRVRPNISNNVLGYSHNSNNVLDYSNNSNNSRSSFNNSRSRLTNPRSSSNNSSSNNNNNNNTLFANQSTKPTLNRVSSYNQSQPRLLPNVFRVRPNTFKNVVSY